MGAGGIKVSIPDPFFIWIRGSGFVSETLKLYFDSRDFAVHFTLYHCNTCTSSFTVTIYIKYTYNYKLLKGFWKV